MPDVSLTIFIDYLLSTGRRRLARIRDWVDSPDYERAFDYWVPLRDWIVEVERGRLTAAELKARVKGVPTAKRTRYDQTLKGFLKFTRRNDGRRIPPPRGVWKYSDLTIKVNPELAYDIRGRKICVKLYFKSERVSSDKAAVIGELMRSALPGFEPRVLDVQSGRLIVPTNIDDLGLLLRAEALSLPKSGAGCTQHGCPPSFENKARRPWLALREAPTGGRSSPGFYPRPSLDRARRDICG